MGILKGRVKVFGTESATAIYPAFIIHEDSLLTMTDMEGNYQVSIEEGEYSLVCSAINFSDTILQIKVNGGEVVRDFLIKPDDKMGFLVGEFQDMKIYRDSLVTKPELSQWDAKKVYDAATGATLQYKWLKVDIADREVFVGDSLFGKSDAFGQYALFLQCGTYPITGKCDGYQSKRKVIKVEPASKAYLNFFLERN